MVGSTCALGVARDCARGFDRYPNVGNALLTTMLEKVLHRQTSIHVRHPHTRRKVDQPCRALRPHGGGRCDRRCRSYGVLACGESSLVSDSPCTSGGQRNSYLAPIERICGRRTTAEDQSAQSHARRAAFV